MCKGERVGFACKQGPAEERERRLYERMVEEIGDAEKATELYFELCCRRSPYKGTESIPAGQTVPTDPLIYRFYEMVMVYGSTYKELIHEEFGDGIMSAIDFDMEFGRLADPNGDRVTITLTGKYLKYKQF